MKQVIRCLGCGDLVRYYGSYKVNLQETIRSTFTGAITEHEIEGQICRDCARKAGYKVKREGGEK